MTKAGPAHPAVTKEPRMSKHQSSPLPPPPSWCRIVTLLDDAGRTLLRFAGHVEALASSSELSADEVPPEIYRQNVRERIADAVEAMAQLERIAAGKQPVAFSVSDVVAVHRQ